jgi:hypothetical protein
MGLAFYKLFASLQSFFSTLPTFIRSLSQILSRFLAGIRSRQKRDNHAGRNTKKEKKDFITIPHVRFSSA